VRGDRSLTGTTILADNILAEIGIVTGCARRIDEPSIAAIRAPG